MRQATARRKRTHALLCGQASCQAEEHVGDDLHVRIGQMAFERCQIAIDFGPRHKGAFNQPLTGIADQGARKLPALVIKLRARIRCKRFDLPLEPCNLVSDLAEQVVVGSC
jgi:hypothetical protein